MTEYQWGDCVIDQNVVDFVNNRAVQSTLTQTAVLRKVTDTREGDRTNPLRMCLATRDLIAQIVKTESVPGTKRHIGSVAGL